MPYNALLMEQTHNTSLNTKPMLKLTKPTCKPNKYKHNALKNKLKTRSNMSPSTPPNLAFARPQEKHKDIRKPHMKHIKTLGF